MKKEIDLNSASVRCKVVQHLLDTKSSVFIHFDPSMPGTLVPVRLRVQTQVVLQIGRNMAIPIPDLRVDEEGVYATLAFKGVPFACFVPWPAVFAVVGDDGTGVVFQDAPKTAVVATTTQKETDRKPATTTSKARPSYLRVVK